MKKIKDFIHLLTIKQTSNVFIQFFRYFITSGLAFIVDFSILWGLTALGGMHYLISTPIAYLSGMIINYIASNLWVFQGRKVKGKKRREFSIFILIGISGMALNQGMMVILTEYIGLYFMISRIISAGINYILKFWARKKWIFNRD
ncbi:MAG: hypothetical protein B6229_00555 [Spirochaetaceae bacterium 4572_7]|nr:MAG: hypothetical protein B6229_00555 [Spirochaetaceae bacterium 4572_7]